jgi:hypothetical protein
MNFNDLILLLDNRSETIKQLASMEVPYQIDNEGCEYYKTKDGYRIEYPNGSKYWYVNGKLHRLDGPAVEYPGPNGHGHVGWLQNGEYHRIDGPAYEDDNGQKGWYINGKQMTEKQFNKWRVKHNPIKESRLDIIKQLASMEVPDIIDHCGNEYYNTKDGYRVEYVDGDRGWYANDTYHRLDGPAYEMADGTKMWYINGRRHRVDGPAIERADGSKAWYINGKKMTEEEFNQWRAKNNPIKESRLETIKQLASMEVPYEIDKNGNEYYKTKDGYRVEYAYGGKIWYNANFQNHRLDGPAVEYADGSKYWFVNDKPMTEEEFNRWRAKHNPIKESRAENLKHLASMEIPYRVDDEGCEYYKTKDGYRLECPNGFKIWYNAKGEPHRLDGPAAEWSNGDKSWYINGEQMTENQFNRWRAWIAKNNPVT